MPLTPAAMALVEELFCKPREVRPLVSAQLKEEETIRIQLTEQQTRILRILGQRRRAAICGGAGTGKTLLAVEKARQLASEGHRTLLLCYNRPLADHLKYVIGNQPNLLPMDFHQLCEWRVKEVERQTGRDLKEDAMLAYPGKDYYDVQLPYALALALEEVPDLYDAVIVDEGQDFREEFWLPVDMLLKDAKQSRLFVFYDPNQAVYRRPSTFPISDVPFSLTINCRNTQFIHDAAYHYFAGELTDPPEIKGAPVEVIDAPSLSAQITRTLSLVVRLIVEEQVAPEDIAVLVPSLSKHSYYEGLCARPLPRGITWAPERHRVPATVLLTPCIASRVLRQRLLFFVALTAWTRFVIGKPVCGSVSAQGAASPRGKGRRVPSGSCSTRWLIRLGRYHAEGSALSDLRGRSEKGTAPTRARLANPSELRVGLFCRCIASPGLYSARTAQPTSPSVVGGSPHARCRKRCSRGSRGRSSTGAAAISARIVLRRRGEAFGPVQSQLCEDLSGFRMFVTCRIGGS